MENNLKTREKALLKTIFDKYKPENLDYFTDQTYHASFTQYNEGKHYQAFCTDLLNLLEEKITFINDNTLKESAQSFLDDLIQFRDIIWENFTKDVHGIYTTRISDHYPVLDEELKKLEEDIKKKSYDVYISYKKFYGLIELEIGEFDGLVKLEQKPKINKKKISNESKVNSQEIEAIKKYFKNPSGKGKDGCPYYSNENLIINSSCEITKQQATQILDLIIDSKSYSPTEGQKATAIYFKEASLSEKQAVERFYDEYHQVEDKKWTRDLINGAKKNKFYDLFCKVAKSEFL
jgi:hypothetical protein